MHAADAGIFKCRHGAIEWLLAYILTERKQWGTGRKEVLLKVNTLLREFGAPFQQSNTYCMFAHKFNLPFILHQVGPIAKQI